MNLETFFLTGFRNSGLKFINGSLKNNKSERIFATFFYLRNGTFGFGQARHSIHHVKKYFFSYCIFLEKFIGTIIFSLFS